MGADFGEMLTPQDKDSTVRQSQLPTQLLQEESSNVSQQQSSAHKQPPIQQQPTTQTPIVETATDKTVLQFVTDTGHPIAIDVVHLLTTLNNNDYAKKIMHSHEINELKQQNQELSDRLKSIEAVQHQILDTLSRHCINFDDYLKHMDSKNSNGNEFEIETNDIEDSQLKNTPFIDISQFHTLIANPNDMESFEQSVAVDDIKNKYLKYFFDKFDLDGKGCCKSIAYKVIDALVHPSIYSHYSWKGRKYKNVSLRSMQNHNVFIDIIFLICKKADINAKRKLVTEALETRCKNKSQLVRIHESGVQKREPNIRKRKKEGDDSAEQHSEKLCRMQLESDDSGDNDDETNNNNEGNSNQEINALNKTNDKKNSNEEAKENDLNTINYSTDKTKQSENHKPTAQAD